MNINLSDSIFFLNTLILSYNCNIKLLEMYKYKNNIFLTVYKVFQVQLNNIKKNIKKLIKFYSYQKQVHLARLIRIKL